MRERPRALVVTTLPLDPAFPYGSAERYARFTDALARHADVHVLFFDRVAPERRPYLGRWERRYEGRLTTIVPRESLLLRSSPAGRVARALHAAFDPLPLDSTPRAGAAVTRIARETGADLVVTYQWLTGHLALAAPKGVPVLAALEEAPERYVDPHQHGSRIGRVLRRAEAAKVRRLYRRLAERGARVVAMSEREAEWFARSFPRDRVATVAEGVDLEQYRPIDSDEDTDVLVVGDLSDRRNTDGLVAAVEAQPTLRWALVGTNPRPEVLALASDRVDVPGFVADLRPRYSRARAVLVPATRATGIKKTLLQGWAMRRAVVAVRAAAVGVDAREGQNILLADDAAEAARRVREVLLDDALRARIASGGHATVRRDHDYSALADRFASICVETARR